MVPFTFLPVNPVPHFAIVDKKVVSTTVSGIFETGYRERYAELFSQYENISKMTDDAARRQAMMDMSSSDLFRDFASEVDDYLAIGYYLGDDYQEKVINPNSKFRVSAAFHNTDIYHEGKMLLEEATWGYGYSSSCESGEALIGLNQFNELFGTSYSEKEQKDFLPVTLTLVGYVHGEDKPVYEHDVTIVGFYKNPDAVLRFSAEEFEMLCAYDHYPYAVYFDDAENAADLYAVAEKRGFYTNEFYFQSVNTVKEIVGIFRDLFVYVALGITLVALMLIVSFSLRTLRHKMREIGILRALGANTGRIALCFVWQMLALWLIVLLVSFTAFGFLLNEANTVLVDGMAQFLNNPAVAQLTVLSPTPFSVLTVLALFLPVLLLSLCVPLLFVRRVKPIKIIRRAD